jgi:fructan beta-fructosidase
MPDTVLYDETHRPQFHFTPPKNWINDPNGLVYFEGEYHLFFQHNPHSVTWGNMTWGHAVSPDLVHWEQLPYAIEPDQLGTIFSGSAVVDWHNSAGFGTTDVPALVAFYTSAGSHASNPVPFTQSIAYSNDRGRTWTKYAGNPVIGHIRASNRDPKVIWHPQSKRWIMALYLDGNDYTLFASIDLKSWAHLGDLNLPGVTECPDFFPLAIDGRQDQIQWVYWGADGGYLLGDFDGRAFTPQTTVIKAEYGPNGYAAQTWSDIPASDGRRLQIAWMRGGKYPAMPFNQQLSFPVELTLKTLPQGIRLCRQPVAEIAALYGQVHRWQDHTLAAGDNLYPPGTAELFDIDIELAAETDAVFSTIIRGIELRYDADNQTLSFQGTTAPLPPENGRVRLRLLVDRTSLEIFGNSGDVSLSLCFLPEAADRNLVFRADKSMQISRIEARELNSAWPNRA